MAEPLLIVGAGPTGLAAGLFLAERHIPCRVIDCAERPSTRSRAQVINPRSLELLEPTGVTAAALKEARPIHRTLFYDGWRQIAELEFGNAHPRFKLSVLPQLRCEALLAEALVKHGVEPEHGVMLHSIWQDDGTVEAALTHSDERVEIVTTPILFGADGAHSAVRRMLDIEFPGSGFPELWPLYDIHLDCPLDWESAHVSFVKNGLVFLLGIRDGVWRVFGDVPDLLDRLPPGTKRGEVIWTSSFHVGHRVAAREMVGHVAIAGDAAHVHSPVAARGMNLGIEDAYVFAACAADALDGDLERLEDYGRIRHDVHRRVVARIERLTQLARGRPEIVGFLRSYIIRGLTVLPPALAMMVELVTGLDHDVKLQ